MVMKNSIKYICACMLMLTASACDEVNPPHFMDINGVYFNNRTSTMTLTDSLSVTFVYETEDEVTVPVVVQLVGRTSDADRPLTITCESENAEEGVDFVLPENPVLPSGATVVEYPVVVKRTEALKSETKVLTLTIHENEFFSLPVTEVVQTGDTVSVLSCSIYFSDMFTKAPSAWSDNELGKFTQQKFELICKVLKMNPADFNDPAKVTLAKLVYISTEMTAYVKEETAKMNSGQPYDEDILDDVTGNPMRFTNK